MLIFEVSKFNPVIFEITILGSGAALPSQERNPGSQLVFVDNSCYLLDCAEGTQIQLIRFGTRYQRIDNIFISHLHGDHFFGLPGLISTYSISGRTRPLNIYSPVELGSIINAIFNEIGSEPGFDVNYTVVPYKEAVVIFEDNTVRVSTIPLDHSVPTCGYLISEKMKDRNLKKDFLVQHEVSIPERKAIKKGSDFTDADGNLIPNREITLDPPPPRSYAYCTDTRYMPHLVSMLEGVDVLYHEATYAEDSKEMAYERYHSTAKQAAMIARDAKVKRLLLGHFSTRYKDVNLLLDEAKDVFPAAELTFDGQKINLK